MTGDSSSATSSPPAPDREAVVERYSGLARIAVAGGTPLDSCAPDSSGDCYGAGRYGPDDLDDVPEAARRAGLGCGNPHAVANIAPGDTVLDLGSGGGLDVILSARRTGPAGHVYGLDASPDMLALARTNVADAGVANAELLHGHIEAIPLPDESVDVVISNCVVNLSPDKPAVLAEAHRVLRPGGRLGITDLVADPGLDPEDRRAAEVRAGAAAGTLTVEEYRRALVAAGFTDADVSPSHEVEPGVRSAIVSARRPPVPAPPPSPSRAHR
jgi:SAM-dependent methyltransferase